MIVPPIGLFNRNCNWGMRFARTAECFGLIIASTGSAKTAIRVQASWTKTHDAKSG